MQPLITGFNKTNNNKILLPLNIKQKNLIGFLYINIEVLSYLLKLRNRKYIFVANNQNKYLFKINFLFEF